MDPGIAAVITVIITIPATLVTESIKAHGLHFWHAQRTLSLSGPLRVVGRFKNGNSVALDDDPPLIQELRSVVLKITGKRCKLTGEFTLQTGTRVDLNGLFEAQGSFENNVAFVDYRSDTGLGMSWRGVMLLYIPDWGDPFAYLVTRSKAEPTSIGILFTELKRAHPPR